jgi:hypothetical protein
VDGFGSKLLPNAPVEGRASPEMSAIRSVRSCSILTQEVNRAPDIEASFPMIQVNCATFERDPDTKEWIERPVAQLLADGDDVTISGPHADWINPDLRIDPKTAERITRADGAERWARLQPFGYRSGDLHVKVIEVAAAKPVAASFRCSTVA